MNSNVISDVQNVFLTSVMSALQGNVAHSSLFNPAVLVAGKHAMESSSKTNGEI
jgi:hypothetical protein